MSPISVAIGLSPMPVADYVRGQRIGATKMNNILRIICAIIGIAGLVAVVYNTRPDPCEHYNGYTYVYRC
jgi:hypothetical protein